MYNTYNKLNKYNPNNMYNMNNKYLNRVSPNVRAAIFKSGESASAPNSQSLSAIPGPSPISKLCITRRRFKTVS